MKPSLSSVSFHPPRALDAWVDRCPVLDDAAAGANVTILLIDAGGRTGSRVLRLMSGLGAPVIGLARDAERIKAQPGLRRTQPVGVDLLRDPIGSLLSALQLVINQPRLVKSPQFAPGDIGFSVHDDDAPHPRAISVHGSQPMLATPQCVTLSFRWTASNDAETGFRCPRLYAYSEIDVRAQAAPATRLHLTQDIRRNHGLVFRAFAGWLESSGGQHGSAASADAGLSYALTSSSASGYAMRLAPTDDEAAYTERATVEVAVPVTALPSAVYRHGASDAQPDTPSAAHALRAATSRVELTANPPTTCYHDAAARQVIVHASRRWVTVRP